MKDDKLRAIEKIVQESQDNKKSYELLKSEYETLKKMFIIKHYEDIKRRFNSPVNNYYEVSDDEFYKKVLLMASDKVIKRGDETNGLYMFSGAYKPTDDYRGPIFGDQRYEITTRDDSEATIMCYVNLERNFDTHEDVFNIDDARMFETFFTVIYPKVKVLSRAEYIRVFDNIKAYFLDMAIRYDQETAKRLVLERKYEERDRFN